MKVLDFGLAKVWTGTLGTSTCPAPTVTTTGTREGALLGTPAYMSPEQARGKPVDTRIDVWASGCGLSEMLSGRSAFVGGTLSDPIARILEREPEWRLVPRSTPARVRDLLRRCLQKDSAQRLNELAEARRTSRRASPRHCRFPELFSSRSAGTPRAQWHGCYSERSRSWQPASRCMSSAIVKYQSRNSPIPSR